MQNNKRAFGFDMVVCSVCGSCTALQRDVNNSNGALYCLECVRAVQSYCVKRGYITEVFALWRWHLSPGVKHESYVEVNLIQHNEALERKASYEHA